ncbi:hypothetical protein P8452_48596 [Trifolium repens]|nr:hypothetical protein P8452_48596 [Trifolium repens]
MSSNNSGDNDSNRNLGDDSTKNGGETPEPSQKAAVEQDLVPPPSTTITYAKQFPDVTKIEVFGALLTTNSPSKSKVKVALESGFRTFVDMASGRYLWRQMVKSSSK